MTRSGLLHILVRNDAGHCTLELDGELDRSNVASLEREILLAETAASATITIDLRGWTSPTSVG
jgi:anti-anti-sigma regulatory factor